VPTGFESLLGGLARQDLILPYFEVSLMNHNWPDHYDIRVDSRPYYGRGDGYFHPSTHAMMDERLLYYHFHPDTRDKMIPERRSLTSEITLSVGTSMHAILQTQMTMAQLIKNPKTDIEHEYRNEEHKVRGRIDWLVNHPNGATYVAEFKTRNQYGWAKDQEPLPSWVAQTNLALDNVGLDMAVVISLEMAWPWRMREWHIRRDPDLIDSIYAKFDRVRDAIARNEPPRYCCPPDSEVMAQCPARLECWMKESAK